MCGIVGIVKKEKPLSESDLLKSMGSLQHRGPDSHNFWISKNRKVGLGHQRLSIIGTENGAQPLSNETGSIQAVVNGEFYDFERIRLELQDKGHQFKTDSDSEVLVHLYEEYGTNCLEYLRGEFAFVLWDAAQNRLFAARDRFGIKPLCFHRDDNGNVYFASEAKALFSLGIAAEWDWDSFFHVSQFQYVLPDRTLFKGIYQVRPGHFLLVKGGEIKDSLYWDQNYPVDQKSNAFQRDEDDLIQEFSERFEEAVRLRLRSDALICCHLSGGLDSSAILGFANQIAEKPLPCFSVGFRNGNSDRACDSDYDESLVAQEMARHAGSEFHSVQVSSMDLLENLSDAVAMSEGLTINGHLSAKFILNKKVRQAGYKVALTGEGSDEILAGYPHLREDLFRNQDRDGALRGEQIASLYSSNRASQGIMLSSGESLPLESVKKSLGYIPSFLLAKGSLGFKTSSFLSESFKQSFSNRDGYQELLASFDTENQLKGRHPVNQSSYLWSKTALANYILKTLGDGTEMANSIEGRVPFLDHPLFEFARTLPLSMKIKGSVEKYILRKAAQPVITETVFRRQKHPFIAPPVSRITRDSDPEVQSFFQDVLGSKAFSEMPFFDSKKMRQYLEKHPRLPLPEQSAMDPVLMTAVSAVLLQERLKLK